MLGGGRDQELGDLNMGGSLVGICSKLQAVEQRGSATAANGKEPTQSLAGADQPLKVALGRRGFDVGGPSFQVPALI